MIILISGASHTGKTFLAQKFVEKYHYSCLSIDHLKMGLIRSGYTDLTPLDDDKLTDYLWPVVREMIKTAIENNQDMIVEGCYVPATWQKDFDEQYLFSIRLICLAFTEEYIEKNFDNIISNASVIEKRLCDDLTKEVLIRDNRQFLEGFGQQVTLIEDSYEQTVDSLLQD